MGSLCCCLHVNDPVENVDSSNHGSCLCPKCFIHNVFNKYGELFNNEQTQALPANQEATALTSNVASSSTQSDINQSSPRTMQFDVNCSNSNTQQDGLVTRDETGADDLHKDAEQHRSDADKPTGSYCHGKSDKCSLESSMKLSLEKLEAKLGFIFVSSEEEDVCPTCLEEYDPENPRIVLQCSHHYHLSCIYEWMERSEACPICGKVMLFDEKNLP